MRSNFIKLLSVSIIFLSILFVSCKSDPKAEPDSSEQFPVQLTLKGLTETPINDSAIISSGYGSSIYPHPSLADHYYLLTDRGPNYDSPPINGSESKGFTLPDYAPRIGLFKREGNVLNLVKEILIKDQEGNPLTGLPNPPEKGGNGEIPVDSSGNIIDFDPLGIDSEGLVVMNDGTFWVSDEYGPYLLHLDENGRTLERISAFSADTTRQLPKVFIKRRPNRGIEGLAITPDQKTLVGTLQSPMYNPDNSVKSISRNTRIFTYEIATGKVREFLYQQNKPNLSNNAITAISATEFLVLERDGTLAEYDPAGNLASGMKHIYKIDISDATDISDPNNRISGLLFEDQTLEYLSDSDLAELKIKPVTKALFFDLLDAGFSYPHDKPEGIFYQADKNILGVVNDNDFGVDSDRNGKMIPKRLRDGTVDFTELVLFKVK